MGIAPTGSGKTAAFIMPILDRLQDQKVPKSRNLQVLVLVPTRELAMQIYDVFIDMCEPLKREIRSMAVYGGMSINPQMKNLYGTEILVATPGRLLELLDHNALSLHEVQHLVIDEADKMFQIGFADEMNRVLSMLPPMKQATLFSATLTNSVKDIQQQLNIEPIVVSVAEEKVDIQSIHQIAYLIPLESKGPFLRYLIKEQKIEQALVFVSSTRTADNVVTKLKKKMGCQQKLFIVKNLKELELHILKISKMAPPIFWSLLTL